MAKDLLLEIGTEEIPAGFIQPALEQMKAQAARALSGQNIGHGEISAWGTPRRLVLYASQVEEMQEDAVQEVLGPAKRVAYDEQGQPSKAATGFAKGQGVEVEKLVLKQTPKGEYICAVKHIKGQPTASILPQILPKLITDITFPKAMRWGSGTFRFARPIHWIVALFGQQVIDFNLALDSGDNLKSGNITFGHRFLGRKEGCVINEAGSYKDVLRAEKVIVDQEERKNLIRQGIADTIAGLNQQDNPDARLLTDDELLETVTCLVEYPVIVLGRFEDDFLKLPKEVLTTSMREHQKYFSVIDGKENLLPYFIGISNIQTPDMGIIRRGYERVLRARLSDARFFYQEDQEIPLSERVDKLKGMIFQEKLGTYYDKTQRLAALANFIVDFAKKHPYPEQLHKNVARAAWLCKADLLTEMVGEFPKLQGIMGREYAKLSGETDIVAQAIEDHYKPTLSKYDRSSPGITFEGMIVSIADKMDNILGCLGVGLIPSGSQDPYGLRRQAAAIMHLLRVSDSFPFSFYLSINKLIDKGLELLQDKLTRPTDEVKGEALALLRQRLAYIYTLEGWPADMVEAVLSADFDQPVNTPPRLKALYELSHQADFENLAVAFRRAAKIIPPGQAVNHISPELLQEPAERTLFEQYGLLKGEVGVMIDSRDYSGALQKLAGLRPYVDNFFDQVLVMAEDERLRRNRLSMLAHIVKLFSQIVDFPKLDVGKITSN